MGHEPTVETLAAQLEAAAAGCCDDEAGRAAQWRAWADRARQGGGVLYRQPPKEFLTWTQVFRRSRALEITMESCLHLALRPAHLPYLQPLLAVFMPREGPLLARLVLDLAQSMATCGQREELLTAAKSAVAACTSALKDKDDNQRGPVHAVAERLLDSSIQLQLTCLNDQARHFDARAAELFVHLGLAEIVKQRLQQLSNTQDLASTLTERMRWAAGTLAMLCPAAPCGITRIAARFVEDLVALGKQRLALLLGVDAKSRSLQTPDVQASLIHLRHLIDTIKQQLDPEDSAGTRTTAAGVTMVQSDSIDQLSEAKRLAARLHNDLENLRKRQQALRAVDDQLLRLKPKAADISRRALEERPRVLQQLATTRTLYNLMISSPEGSAQEIVQVREAKDAVVSALMEELQALAAQLHTKHQCQQEYGHSHVAVLIFRAKQRMQFCLAKMVPLEAQYHQLQNAGKLHLAKELLKPLEALRSMHKVRLAEAEAILAEGRRVEATLRSGPLQAAQLMLPEQPSVQHFLQHIGLMLHQLEEEHMQLNSGHVQPGPPLPTPLPEMLTGLLPPSIATRPPLGPHPERPSPGHWDQNRRPSMGGAVMVGTRQEGVATWQATGSVERHCSSKVYTCTNADIEQASSLEKL
eukprot:SM000080S22988  [mRNA]  locus=s80:502628:508255:- [translate_table: standard]